MSLEKSTPILSAETLRKEYLGKRQEALERRGEFTQALDAVSDINTLPTVLRRYAFLSDSVDETGRMAVPIFKEVFPEYQGRDEFGYQKDDYAISAETPLETTLEILQDYNRGEITQYELYQELGFDSPLTSVIERVTGVSGEKLIRDAIADSSDE